MLQFTTEEAGRTDWLDTRGVSLFWEQTQASETETKCHVDKFALKYRQEQRWSELKVGKKKVWEAENQLAAWILNSQWWFQSFVWKPFQSLSQSLGLKGWQEALPTFWCLLCNPETSGSLNRRKKVDWRVYLNSYWSLDMLEWFKLSSLNH